MGLFLDYVRSQPLYKELCTLTDSPHGNLLERTSDATAEAQTEFLRWALNLSHAVTIIETGTNKGMFGCLLSVIAYRGVLLSTIDQWDQSFRATQAIKDSGQIAIRFHHGDSRKCLAAFKQTANFAWIDGGHEGDVPLSDLLNCHRLRVPYVAVDDTVEPDVGAAVQNVIDRGLYEIIPNPFAAHDKRNAVLLKGR